MSLLSRNRQQKAVTNIPAPNGVNIQLINGRLIGYEDNLKAYIDKGYNINDIVYSIVHLIANKARVAPWSMYRIKDEQAYKQYNAIIRQTNWGKGTYVKALNLQYKALTPVKDKDAGKWGELIKNPNEVDSMADFVYDDVSWGLLTGNSYTWGNTLKGGVNEGTPNELIHLPSHYMEIFAGQFFPVRAIGYWLNIYPNAKFPVEEIMHLNNFNPNFNVNGSQLYGMAPLKAGLKRLKKSNSLIDAEASSFQNEGIKGVLYMENQVGNVDGDQVAVEVEKLADTMRTQWSGTENRARIGLGGYTMGWIPIGLNSEEMEMIASGMMDLRYMCNLFGGVPSRLLNDPENQAEANIEEAERALTTRCTLPHLIKLRERLNRKGERHWKMNGMVADFDMSCYNELQADAKEVAQWTSQILAISPNEQRELAGLAALPDEEYNEPWVLTGTRMPKSEYDLTPVDNALNEDDTEENL